MREIQPADYPAIQALHRHVGWPARSLAGWHWVHDDPARTEARAPRGWVVDGPDGRPAAHVGNLVQRFWLGDRVFYGATGFSIIVTDTVRGSARQMIRAFVNQPGMFAHYVLNANARSQPLYARHRMKAWPDQTHATKLSWLVDPVPLATGRLLRAAVKAAPGIIPHLGEPLMNGRLGRAQALRLQPGVVAITDLGDTSPYAAFWTALRSEGRLLADRSPAALRRRFADPDLTTPPIMLGLQRDGAIVGYGLAMMAKNNIIEPPVLEILDLEALEDAADAIPVLMSAMIRAARPLGAAKVRLQVVSPRLLRRLGSLAKRARREGGWGHCHVRFAADAPDPALWSPTPYDGDYGTCLRPLPVRPVTVVSPREATAAQHPLAA